MKVILIHHVNGLGKIGDIKEVTQGYANNYLFAKNLAVQASRSELNKLNLKVAKQSKQANRELAKQQVLAEKLNGFELEIKQKASPNGSLYAALGATAIAEALKKVGFLIEQKQIQAPIIKSAGQYDVVIKFSHGLEADIKLIVQV